MTVAFVLVTKAAQVLDQKYKLGRVLHKGDRAVIVEATHVELREPVAIKVLDAQQRDPRFAARLRREARQSAAIRSEHVVRYLDIGHLTDGRPYVVMERLVGASLAERISNGGALPLTDAIDVMLQTCEAVAAAHARGLIHRALRTSNIFCVDQPDHSVLIKVLNFGTARAVDAKGLQEDHGLTVAGLDLEAPDYRAPEQIVGRRDLDGRADIWSLGVILYEMVSGTRPFTGASPQEIVRRVLVADIAPAPRMPQPIWAIIERCLKTRTEERWATVADLADALAPYAGPTSLRYPTRIRQILATAPPPDTTSDEDDVDAQPTIVRDVLAFSRDESRGSSTKQMPAVRTSKLPRIDDGRTGARSFPWLQIDQAQVAAMATRTKQQRRALSIGIGVAIAVSIVALVVALVPLVQPKPARDPHATGTSSPKKVIDSPANKPSEPAGTTTTAAATTAVPTTTPPAAEPPPAIAAPATNTAAQAPRPHTRTPAAGAHSAKPTATEDPWGWER